MRLLHRLARSPYLLLNSGLVLIGTSLVEILDAIEDPALGVHHGVLVLGFTQLIRALPHVLHGAEDLDEAAATLANGDDAAKSD
jgi:hypothetical protein